VTDLEKIEAEENDPKRKEWLVKRSEALTLVKKAEVEKAIALLQAGPAAYKTDEDKKLLEQLQQKWKPRDEGHRTARTFIYKTFATLSGKELLDRLGEAETALSTCITADDEYSPVKFREIALQHVTKLDAESKRLNPELNADDEAPSMIIREIFPKLRRLIEMAEATKGDK
jgi:hypothetical protein